MPYVNKNMSQPLTKGHYKCLVDSDGFGSLVETGNNKFDGVDWDPFESNCQFITHWWSSNEDYDTIFDRWEKEMMNVAVEQVNIKYANKQ